MVASLRQQYGLRIQSDEFDSMGWEEFSDLVSGLTEQTPLVRVAQIRTEKDPQRIKAMTPEQRKMRNEWQKRMAQAKKGQTTEQFLADVQNMFAKMFADRG